LFVSQVRHCIGLPVQSRSPFPTNSGSLAMLMAIRRASSFVSTFAYRASASPASGAGL
jgi:hypothetical protein